ncbi:MAG: hypothetical protein AAFV53_17080 [Myxococcota bacterium]
MLHTDSEFAARVEQAVVEIEEQTDAELVVVATPRSGSYPDAPLFMGIIAGMVMLLLVLFAPVSVHPVMVPVEVALAGALTWFLSRGSPPVVRTFTTKTRRQRQVTAAARAAFVEEAVYGTRNRTGILIYVSALEDRVIVLPDSGLAARIPGGEWNALRWGDQSHPSAPGDLDHFIDGLQAVGVILARHVPPTDDNPNELPDAPRVRS